MSAELPPRHELPLQGTQETQLPTGTSLTRLADVHPASPTDISFGIHDHQSRGAFTQPPLLQAAFGEPQRDPQLPNDAPTPPPTEPQTFRTEPQTDVFTASAPVKNEPTILSIPTETEQSDFFTTVNTFIADDAPGMQKLTTKELDTTWDNRLNTVTTPTGEFSASILSGAAENEGYVQVDWIDRNERTTGKTTIYYDRTYRTEERVGLTDREITLWEERGGIAFDRNDPEEMDATDITKLHQKLQSAKHDPTLQANALAEIMRDLGDSIQIVESAQPIIEQA